MNRKETEQALIQKMEEMTELYLQYNPDGQYLSMAYVSGNLHINNSYYGKDSARPINAFRNEKRDILDGHLVLREDAE